MLTSEQSIEVNAQTTWEYALPQRPTAQEIDRFLFEMLDTRLYAYCEPETILQPTTAERLALALGEDLFVLEKDKITIPIIISEQTHPFEQTRVPQQLRVIGQKFASFINFEMSKTDFRQPSLDRATYKFLFLLAPQLAFFANQLEAGTDFFQAFYNRFMTLDGLEIVSLNPEYAELLRNAMQNFVAVGRSQISADENFQGTQTILHQIEMY